LPEIAAEWHEWSDLAQLNFVVEWPIKEERLAQLREWVRQDELTPPQLDRYRQLLDLMDRYRPILDRLLAD